MTLLTIAALIANADERASLVAASASRASIEFCQTFDDLMRREERGGVSNIVCELRDAFGAHVASGSRRPHMRQWPTPIVIRMSLTPGNARELCEFVNLGYAATASLRGFEEIGQLLDGICNMPGSHDPQPHILRIIGSHPIEVQGILVATVILGEKRRPVGDAAAICGLSQRTVERRLDQGGYPPLRQLFRWSLLLHAAWRLEVLNWSTKRAAAVAGFRDSDAFATYLRRLAGYTPGELRVSRSFDGLLETYRRLIASRVKPHSTIIGTR